MYASLVVSIECVRECGINNIRMCAPVCVCVCESVSIILSVCAFGIALCWAPAKFSGCLMRIFEISLVEQGEEVRGEG